MRNNVPYAYVDEVSSSTLVRISPSMFDTSEWHGPFSW
jgi:hypothetical protein